MGGGGKEAKDLKYKKKSENILPSVREIAIVIEVTWNKAGKSKVILKIVIPIEVEMSVMTVTVVTSMVRLAAAGQDLKSGRPGGQPAGGHLPPQH